MNSMKKKTNHISGFFLRVTSVLLFAVILMSCGSSALEMTATGEASVTAEKSPGVETNQPSLPPVFQSDLLNPLDTPRTYIQNNCKYLRAKWNATSAELGTVVLIIMVRDVRGSTPENPADVEDGVLRKAMRQLKDQGFEVINTEQLRNFMERNARIPRRSAVIVRDGNYGKKDFYDNFGAYWKDWKWSIVNGWVSGEDVPDDLWNENAQMEYEGFVDHQAGGVQRDTFIAEDSSKVIIARELQGSLDGFAAHFGKSPTAFIWPNGGFGLRPAEIARLLDYQLGFTMNSRGPVMYNWVPLADQPDPERPAYIPEGAIKDPLMTLPRYFPGEVLSAIDEVRLIGRQAKTYALANQAVELEYYKTICEPEYGPMPDIQK
jgi:hypothetical protein